MRGLFAETRVPDARLLRRLGVAAVICASILAVLLATLYARYAYPYLDDFCFMVRTADPVSTANWYYLHWSGRWSAMALYALVARDHDYANLGVGRLVIWSIPLWYAGFYLICATVMQGQRFLAKAGVALVLFAIFWSGSPGISDLFYWTGGIISYAVPFLLTGLALNLLLQPGPNPFNSTLAVVAAFLAPTFNELAGIVLVPVLAGVVVSLVSRRQPSRHVMTALGATLVATAIVVLAPGTGVRFGDQPARVFSVAGSAVKLFRPYDSVFAYVFDARILALVLAASCTTWAGVSQTGSRTWHVIVLTLMASAAGNAAFVVATGEVPSYRVLGYCFAILLAGAAVASWHVRGQLRSPALDIVSLFVLAGLIVTAPNVAMALHDLPNAGNWRGSQRTFWAKLERGRGLNVKVADLPYYPSIFFTRQISADPNHPFNRCVSRRFGLRSVQSVGPDGTHWRVY